MIELPPSVPTISQYEKLLTTELFHDMEANANAFLQANQEFLNEYAARWVKDPFHQWSRQWEYPYVYTRISEYTSTTSAETKILDAGSGITFFPYYLRSKLAQANIVCCDIDPKLKATYDSINKNQGESIRFINQNLENIPGDDESIDVIYCISVIEHTNNFSKIVDEFYRVLKPGGKLIVTFDISLDGTAQLPPDKCEILLDCIYTRFKENARSTPLASLLSKPDIVTTNYAYSVNRNLIPMNRFALFKGAIKSLLQFQPVKKFPVPLSFYCLDVTKK